MRSVTESVEVDVPVRTAYDQWTRFAELPEFMDGVDSVVGLDGTHQRWTTTVAGVHREFDAVVTELRRDERVAWRATSGPPHAGVVTFDALGQDRARVTVRLDWAPQGLVETVGSIIGADDLQVRADLQRFKSFVEDRRAHPS